MNKKEVFIQEIGDLIYNKDIELSQEAIEFFEDFKAGKKSSSTGFTENGKKVFEYMKTNYETQDNSFQSKLIGAEIGMTGRSVSGSMRKLVTDGYVEKVGQNPVTYALTAAGIEYEFDK